MEPIPRQALSLLTTVSIAGLDALTRKSILETLDKVSSHRSPRIILGNRLQDGIPDWISHVAFVEPPTNSSSSSWVVRTGKADGMKDRIARFQEVSTFPPAVTSQPRIRSDGEVLVELNDVNVSYHGRKVSISGFSLSIVSHTFLGTTKHELDSTGKRKVAPPGIEWYFLQRFRLRFSFE